MSDAIPSAGRNATIDPKEHDKFHQLADTWWDETGPFWPLHTLNKLRVEWILVQLKSELDLSESTNERPLTGLSVLDIGCGGGILSESLARLGATVTGIDVVEKNIHIAQTHAAKTQLDITYERITVEDMAERGDQFDVVFNMEVVEHVAELDTFLHASQALVKPQGSIFISTINRNIIAWLIAIVGAEYILRWLPKGTHRYALLRKPSEIEPSLINDHFDIKKSVGVAVNPFNKKMRITRSRVVNYMLHAIRNTANQEPA